MSDDKGRGTSLDPGDFDLVSPLYTPPQLTDLLAAPLTKLPHAVPEDTISFTHGLIRVPKGKGKKKAIG